MQEDTSADVQTNDDDIEDAPLLDQPVAETQAPEAPKSTEDKPADEGSETEDTKETDKPATEAKDTEATADSEESEQTTEDTSKEKGKPDPALAYKAYQERQQARKAVEQTLDQTYGPKTEEQLVDEGYDPVQAQIQAVREEMQYREQRAQIAELNAGMQAEAVNVLHDFPVFDPSSSDYDPDFTAMVQATYQQAARVQTDDSGIILNAEIPLYDYHKQMAEIYNRGASKGTQQGQAEMQEMLSKTEAIGGGSQGSRGPETLEEMGERLADLPLY